MNYQAVIIDLDGTLLNDRNQISVNNVEAIQQAQKEGIEVTLASGRPHALMLPYAELLGISTSMICCNGAYRYDIKTGAIVDAKPFDKIQLSELLTTLNIGHFSFTLYTERGIFSSKLSEHFNGLETQANDLGVKVNMEVISSLHKLQERCGDVYKVLVSSSDCHALSDLRSALQHTLQADLSAPNKLDITSMGTNKGQSALKWLQNNNLNPIQTIAFGDGDNDIELFKAVGEPVAMDNASPALRGIANLIITDNNGCGIGQYLRLIVREGQHTCQHSFSY